ncbi:Flagellar basal-body rod protein FlgB [Chitinispirillum alkaliphilum]|nr:Flagellar basal-body rod protein FlgB [Chitinispirillum alkaliphilum]
MFGGSIFNKTSLPVIKKTMDAAMLRNRAISNNIANVTTPGYRRVEVSFEDQLRKAMDGASLRGASTRENHLRLGGENLSNVSARGYRPNDPTLPSGVNNVDIDMEMAKLAETQIQFNFAVKRTQGIYRKLNAAIQGRSIPLQ